MSKTIQTLALAAAASLAATSASALNGAFGTARTMLKGDQGAAPAGEVIEVHRRSDGHLVTCKALASEVL